MSEVSYRVISTEGDPGRWDARLRVETARLHGRLVITAGGDIDFVTAPRMYERIQGEVEEARWIVLDLGDVRFIDSSGLGLIVKLWKAARARGGDFAVARPQSNCVVLLDRTGLSERIVMAPTMDDAVARIDPRGRPLAS